MSGFLWKGKRLSNAVGLIMVTVFSIFLFIGCRSTSTAVKPDTFAQYKSLVVQLSATEAAGIPDDALSRIKGYIKQQIKQECCPHRFESISDGPARPQDLLMTVKITEYNRGSSAARFWVGMGAGRMKIEGMVELKDAATGNKLAGEEISDTYSGGGVIGAMQGMGNVETGFADKVADFLDDTLKKK